MVGIARAVRGLVAVAVVVAPLSGVVATAGQPAAAVSDSAASKSSTVRPCGQVKRCPSITLEGPIPNPYPDAQGVIQTIPFRPGDTEKNAYVEEEYFFSGTTNVFNYDQAPAVRGTHPGDALALYKPAVPYKTRMLVRRPEQARAFNGTVVVEFMNSSGGLDGLTGWLAQSHYFSREGIVYIGVTTSANQAMPFLKGGCGGIAPSCGTRYASLDLSDNGQEYELISQLVTALKSHDDAQVPLPGTFRSVRRVFVYGESQQAGSVIEHANEFSFPLVDGYEIVSGSSSRAVRGGMTAFGDATSQTCGTATALAYPDCVSLLPTGEQRFPRTNLRIPVLQVMSERDVGTGVTRLPDSDTSRFASFRRVEIPGSPHTTIHKLEILPGLLLGDLCMPVTTSFADGPIFASHVANAALENMRRQVEWGIKPPKAPRISITDGVIDRDQYGNAKGGVRLPEMDVPTASYEAFNSANTNLPPILVAIGDLACGLAGRATPFSAEQLATLYPTHGGYVTRVFVKTVGLFAQRFLLFADAVKHVRDALQSDIGA